MMDKDKYLDKLLGKLDKLPLSELGNVLQHYEKYFEDAGEENEQDVIAELGTPKALAARVQNEYFSKEESYLDDVLPDKKGKVSNKRIALLICTFFIWIPVMAVVYIFEASLVIAGSVFFILGIFTIVTGIMTLFSSVPTGLFFIGTGFVLIALGILVFVAGLVLIRLTGKAVALMFGKGKRGEGDE